jgi:hypothetical protein
MEELEALELAERRTIAHTPKPKLSASEGAAAGGALALFVLSFFLTITGLPSERFGTATLMTVGIAAFVGYLIFRAANERYIAAWLKELKKIRDENDV